MHSHATQQRRHMRDASTSAQHSRAASQLSAHRAAACSRTAAADMAGVVGPRASPSICVRRRRASSATAPRCSAKGAWLGLLLLLLAVAAVDGVGVGVGGGGVTWFSKAILARARSSTSAVSEAELRIRSAESSTPLRTLTSLGDGHQNGVCVDATAVATPLQVPRA
jgi:hypothetical protein